MKQSISLLAKDAKSAKGKLSIGDPDSLKAIEEINKLTGEANKLTKDRTTLNKELASAQSKVNAEEAQTAKNLERLTADLDSLRKQRTALNRAEKNGIVSAKAANQERTRLNTEIKRSSKALNEATKSELGLVSAIDKEKKTLRELIKARESLSLVGKDNTKQARDLEKQIEKTSNRIKKAGKTTENAKNGFQRMGKSIETVKSRIVGLGNAIGIFIGLNLFKRAFSSAFDDIAAFDTGLRGVGKTTGLTGIALSRFGADVIGLSKELKSISTEKLFELSEAAGQLGIKGRKDILKFAEVTARLEKASDVVGEDGAKSIARILNITGESINSVDRFGSALVDLGNNSAASEAEILSNASEIAKATSAYKLGSTEVLGLSAALVSLGSKPEAAGSGIASLFIKFEKATLKGGKQLKSFADVLGVTSEEAKNLFNNDKSGAFLKFTKGLNGIEKSGGSVVGTLESLGLADKRVIKTLAPLAANYEILEESLNRSGKAYAQNTALTEESEVALNSLQSAYDSIGVSLSNYINETNETTGAGNFFKDSLIFIAENLETILNVLGNAVKAFLTYKAVIIAISTVQKVQLAITTALRIAKIGLARGVGSATKAMKAFNAAQKANIIAAVAAAVILLVGALKTLFKESTLAIRIQKNLNDVRDDAAKATANEKAELQGLLIVAQDETQSKEDRLAAIKRLNEISPEYLGNLTLETINTQEAAAAIDLYIKALDRKALAQAIDNKRTELFNKQVEERLASTDELTKDLIKDKGIFTLIAGGFDVLFGEGDGISGDLSKQRAKNVDDIQKEIDALNEYQKELLKAGEIDGVGPSPTENNNTTNRTPGGDDEDDKELTRLEELRKQLTKNREDAESLATENTLSSDKRISELNEEGLLLKDQIKTITDLLALRKKEEEVKELNDPVIDEGIRANTEQENVTEDLLRQEQDLLIEFRQKKLDGAFKSNKSLIKAEEELQRKLIDLKIQGLINDQTLLDVGSSESKAITAQVKQLEIEKAAIGKQNETIAETQRLAVETFTNFFITQSDKRIAKIEEEISAAQKQADVLAGLAKSGNITAQQSLAQQDQIIAEANKRKEQEEKRKQRVLLASSVLQAYNSELASGTPSGEAFAKAITSTTVLTQFINSLPTFFDGIENTGKHGQGIDGRGGFLSVLHPNERVVPKEFNDKLGDVSNKELASIVENKRAGKYIVNAQYMKASNGGQSIDKEMIGEIKGLRMDIKNQPSTEYGLDEITSTYATIISSKTEGNNVTQNRFKVQL